MLSLKAGVKVKGLQPEILLAIMVAKEVFYEAGYPLIITSLLDGKHSKNSLHYSGNAVDYRSKHIKSYREKQEILKILQFRLGSDYDIILEGVGTTNEHYHVECHPK